MLGKKNRIQKSDIPKIVRSGDRIKGSMFDIKYVANADIVPPKFAIVVSKRIEKRAVARNTIKRKFRAALFELVRNGDIDSGQYIILTNDNKLIDVESGDLREMIREMLRKI